MVESKHQITELSIGNVLVGFRINEDGLFISDIVRIGENEVSEARLGHKQ
jgi:hypothetical protein